MTDRAVRPEMFIARVQSQNPQLRKSVMHHVAPDGALEIGGYGEL